MVGPEQWEKSMTQRAEEIGAGCTMAQALQRLEHDVAMLKGKQARAVTPWGTGSALPPGTPLSQEIVSVGKAEAAVSAAIASGDPVAAATAEASLARSRSAAAEAALEEAVIAGDTEAIEAAEAAIANPLLDDTSMHGAQGVLINITAGSDITLFEVDEAANRIRDEVAEDANIIFGSTFEESLEGRVRVSVVATGIESAAGVRPRPVTGLIADPVEEPIATSMPVPPRPEMEQVSVEVEVSSPEIEYRPEKSDKSPEQKDLIDHVTANNEAPAVSDQDHSETTIKEDVFIPAPAADTSATPEKSADPFAAAEIMNAGNSQEKDRSNKKPGLTLFERVTGVTIGERKKERKERVMPPPPIAIQPPGVSEEPNINPITEVIKKVDVVTEEDFGVAVKKVKKVKKKLL